MSILLAFVTVTLISVGQNKSEWPLEIKDERGSVVLFQPQVEKLTQALLESRCAVLVKTANYPDGVFGAMWFECHIRTDKDERIVYLDKLNVTAANFPDSLQGLSEGVSLFLEEMVESNNYSLSLDRLISDIDLNEELNQINNELDNTPPEIIFAIKPSVLIMIDGEPIFKPIDDTKFNYVVNTPYFIVRDNKEKINYLKGGNYWYKSNEILSGWEFIETPPSDLLAIAEQAMEVPQDEIIEDSVSNDTIIAELIVRTAPAELLQSDGQPAYAPLNGTNLLYMNNSNDDIIMDISTQNYYVLISGRWYSTKSLDNGPWQFVKPNEVPDEFASIPEESEVGGVRASVSGTTEAKEAVLENQIPQTASVNRSEASVEVIYDGDPIFKEIEGTKMKYAVNTDKSVLIIEGKYYCCDNAVWFESSGANGPWEISTKIPEQVQEIPPSNPNYNVKYVYIYDVTPTVVYIGYTPGYVHSYTYYGCVYYGTGFYYHPWYGRYYYPHPCTYGYRVHYNPYSGWGFSFGYRYGPPYGWMAFGWHASYHRGYWGPAGYRYGHYHGYKHGYHHGHRPPSQGHRPPSQGGNKPGKPSQLPSTGQRPSQGNASGSNASNNIYNKRNDVVKPSPRPSTSDSKVNTRPAQPSQKPTQQPTDRKNNVYTDKNGNVYRKNGEQWQKRDNGSWNNVQNKTDRSKPSQGIQQPQTRPSQGKQQPQTRPSQGQNSRDLNQYQNSRDRGSQRSQQYNQNRQNHQYRQPSQNRSAAPRQNSGGGSRPAGRRR